MVKQCKICKGPVSEQYEVCFNCKSDKDRMYREGAMKGLCHNLTVQFLLKMPMLTEKGFWDRYDEVFAQFMEKVKKLE